MFPLDEFPRPLALPVREIIEDALRMGSEPIKREYATRFGNLS
jgi:hypothetical protein